MKKILIIGGTGFVGRLLTEKLVASGEYDITLFNRGKTNPDVFPNVRKIVGDRKNGDDHQLCEEEWDVAIDMIGFQVQPFTSWIAKFKKQVKRYIFISTCSVYDDEKVMGTAITEESPVFACSAEQIAEDNPKKDYGELKAEMERILQSHTDFDSIILRPSLIYGKYDPTDRFYYWLYRLQTQGQLLLPESNFPTGYTHSEDFANIIFEAISMKEHNKLYQVVTHRILPFHDMIKIAKEIMGSSTELVPATEAFLEEQKIKGWSDIALWAPWDVLNQDCSKLQRDFKTTLDSYETSIEKSVAYYASLGWPVPKTGISLEREAELMKEM